MGFGMKINKRLDNYFINKHHRHTTSKKKSLEIIEKVKYLLLGVTVNERYEVHSPS